MLLLEEITIHESGRKEENRILVNPHLITTVRHSGIYTTVNMSDGQVIKVSDSIHSIKSMLEKFNLSVVDHKVVKKLND